MVIPGRILVVGVILLLGSAMGCHSRQTKPCSSCTEPAVSVAGLGNVNSHEYVILTPAEKLGQINPQMVANSGRGTLTTKLIDADTINHSASPAALTERTSFSLKPTLLPEPTAMPVPIAVGVVAPQVEQVRYDHAKDYGWVEGQLHYVESKAVWQIMYASLDVEDSYGGGFTLVASDDLLNGFKDGDFVHVQGNLIDTAANEPRPLFQAQSIRRQN